MTTDDAIPQLHDHLLRAAARLPDKSALVCGAARLTYRELDEASNALAHTLQARGVQRGDRVMVFADNTPQAAVAFWATLKACAVFTPVHPMTRPDKLRYLVDDCRPAALVTDMHLFPAWQRACWSRHVRTVIASGTDGSADAPRAPRLLAWDEAIAAGDRTRPPVRRGLDVDLAAILYTSGSTGEPKGVMLTHRNMLAAASSIAAYLGLGEDDVIVNALPLSFDYGLYQMILAFRQGARLVLERSFAWPAQVLRRMSEERVTVFPGVPPLFSILAELGRPGTYDLACVRTVTSTTAPLQAKHIRTLRALFPGARIFSMYGLTECKRCTYLPPEDLDRKPDSVGIAIPNTELWIEDERGRRVPPNTVGELVIRGATVMRGYWEKPEETARALKPGPLPGEFVLRTGDYCRLDEDGYLYFVGRADDLFKSGGEKVAPREIEAVLYDLPGVRHAAVVGVPDEVLGRAVKAVIVPEAGARLTEQDVRRHCRARLESTLVPRHVEFVAELPMSATGKIRRAGLT